MALKRKSICKAFFNNFYALISSIMFHYNPVVFLSVMVILSTTNFLITNFQTECIVSLIGWLIANIL